MTGGQDQLDDIEVRLLSPMVTYKENATEDAPALVAALRAVLAECDGQIRASTARIRDAITAALDVTP